MIEKNCLLYFSSDMCGLCEVLNDVIYKLEEDYPHMVTYKLTQEDDPGLFEKLEIDGVPTIYLKEEEKLTEIPYPEDGYQYEFLKDYLKEVFDV